jgi:hypothetical protein
MKNITFPAEYSLQKTGITQSLLSKYLQCPRAFMLAVNGYTMPGKGRATGFGSLFHEMLDKIYTYNAEAGGVPSERRIKSWIERFTSKNKPMLSGKQTREIERDKAVTLLLLIEYIKRFQKIDFEKKRFFDIEDTFDIRFKRYRLRGKIDGKYLIGGQKKWLMEHKTKGQINIEYLMQHLTFDIQNLFYITADEIQSGVPVHGVLYNIIRNPKKTWRKDQTLSEFVDELRADVQGNPTHYFTRFEIAYTARDKKEFRKELFYKLYDIEQMMKGNRPVLKNETNCYTRFPCEFLGACASRDMSGFDKKELFTELQ